MKFRWLANGTWLLTAIAAVVCVGMAIVGQWLAGLQLLQSVLVLSLAGANFERLNRQHRRRFANGMAARLQDAEESLLVWTTADGRRLRVCDMEDDHLRNTIFYINKAYARMYAQAGPDSDLWIENTPSGSFVIYDAMRREADRRRLRWI